MSLSSSFLLACCGERAISVLLKIIFRFLRIHEDTRCHCVSAKCDRTTRCYFVIRAFRGWIYVHYGPDSHLPFAAIHSVSRIRTLSLATGLLTNAVQVRAGRCDDITDGNQCPLPCIVITLSCAQTNISAYLSFLIYERLLMHIRLGSPFIAKSLIRSIVMGYGLLVTACSSTSGDLSITGTTASGRFKTLDGARPLVIGHRGLPGLYPEETRASYESAADAGADSLELDLHMTKDCVLVARHNPWLSDNTNVAEVAKTNAVVADRKRTVPGVLVNVKYPAVPENGPTQYLSDLTNPNDPKSVLKSLVVDGEDHTNDWSISDFTMAELRQWIGGTTYDARDQRPTDLNGKLPILSFQEVIDIAKAKSAATGRLITTYPESKNPIWNNTQAIANGCGVPGGHPFEEAFLKDNDLNRKDAPVFVQSFDPASLILPIKPKLAAFHRADWSRAAHSRTACVKSFNAAGGWRLAG